MAKRTPDPTDDHTEELTVYVTPAMKTEVAQLAKVKGVSVSTIGRWAFSSWLKDQKR